MTAIRPDPIRRSKSECSASEGIRTDFLESDKLHEVDILVSIVRRRHHEMNERINLCSSNCYERVSRQDELKVILNRIGKSRLTSACLLDIKSRGHPSDINAS